MKKLKEFDFKTYMLEKGERVGLIAAGVLCGLFVFGMLYTWATAGSPTERAEVLQKEAQRVKSLLDNPNRKPGPADLPPADAEKQLAAGVSWDPASPSGFAMLPLTPGGGMVGGGRRVPQVFNVVEASADVARVQVREYYLVAPPRETDPIMIMCLRPDEGAEATPSAPASAGSKSRLDQLRALLSRGRGGMGGPGGLGGLGRPGMGGSGAAGGAMAPPSSPMGMGSAGGLAGGTDKKDMKAFPKRLTDLKADDHPAEKIQPVRMAIVAASFPYKKQLEEFQAKLGLRSVNDVINEVSVETGPEKEPLKAFRFLGVTVERRELDRDGQPSKELDREGKPRGEFREVRLNDSYRPYIFASGQRYEEDDPRYELISFDGLVMPKLMRLEEGEGGAPAAGPGGGMPMPMGTGSAGGPPGRPKEKKEEKKAAHDEQTEREYPKVEERLETLKTTLTALEGKKAEQIVLPDQFKTDDFNVFKARRNTPRTGSGEGMPMPMPGAGRPMPGVTPPTGTPSGSNPEDVQGEVPEYCLVRVIDVTVEPGRTYEYRLQIRMANPNYNRKDVASTTYAAEKELTSPWSDVPIIVHVDPELYYYAVDEAKLNGPRYSGPKGMVHEDRQVALEAHRWLEGIKLTGGSSWLLVGEWVVADRFIVNRGEYIGRKEKVQVPYWRYTREEFDLATEPGSRSKTPGIEVEFGFGRNDRNPPEAILVDIDPGKESYSRVAKRTEDKVEYKPVSDNAAVEILMLTPDGKLRARNGAEDLHDDTRKKRREAYIQRIKDIKENKSDKAGPGAGPKKPFGGSGS